MASDQFTGRRLVRIKDIGEGFPLRKSTLYSWRHSGKHPSIFVEIGRAVCVDLGEFDRVFRNGGQETGKAGAA